MQSRTLLGLILLTLMGLPSCDVFLPQAPDDSELLDGPREGLSHAQARLFIRGDEEFGRARSTSDTTARCGTSWTGHSSRRKSSLPPSPRSVLERTG